MSFKFKINSIVNLEHAKIAVFTGSLLEGSILTESKAFLLQDGLKSPITIKGVVLEGSTDLKFLSITAALWQPSARAANPGDEIIYVTDDIVVKSE